MLVDRKLNLVLDLVKEAGTKKDEKTGREETVYAPYAHVHHTPIAEEVWNAHSWVLTQVVHRLYQQRMTPPIASRVALNLVTQVAKELGATDAIEGMFLPEVWRLTTVLMKGPTGYEMIPLDEAAKSLPADDVREVRNYVVFFTSASWFHWRQERETGLYPLMRDSGVQIVSLNSTEYLASLRMSTQTESSGEKAALSSIPH